MNNKIIKQVTVLFIFSWLALAVFAWFFVLERAKNSRLSANVKVCEKNSSSLMRELKLCQNQMVQQTEALDYLQWQFLLKEQVANAQKRLQERINLVTAAKKDRPLLNLLYYNLGLNLILAVDFDAAISAFQQAIAYGPKDAESYYNLGLLSSIYEKNTKNAIKYYKKYLELAPPNSLKSGEVKERIEVMQK